MVLVLGFFVMLHASFLQCSDHQWVQCAYKLNCYQPSTLLRVSSTQRLWDGALGLCLSGYFFGVECLMKGWKILRNAWWMFSRSMCFVSLAIPFSLPRLSLLAPRYLCPHFYPYPSPSLSPVRVHPAPSLPPFSHIPRFSAQCLWCVLPFTGVRGNAFYSFLCDLSFSHFIEPLASLLLLTHWERSDTRLPT